MIELVSLKEVMSSKPVRIIARLDIKNHTLVKPVQMEGLRVIGNPTEYAEHYFKSGIDEIVCIDIVASLYDRNNILKTIEQITRNVFIPVTVGGGIRSVMDAQQALRSGADKIAVNTAALKNPGLITQIAREFGSQCMVLSVEAKRTAHAWQAYCDNGREPSGRDVVEWVSEAVERGAGEILLTSVDQEGTAEGLDCELLKEVTAKVTVPVIASGGAGKLSHISDAIIKSDVDGVALAYLLHYKKNTIEEVKEYVANKGIRVSMRRKSA